MLYVAVCQIFRGALQQKYLKQVKFAVGVKGVGVVEHIVYLQNKISRSILLCMKRSWTHGSVIEGNKLKLFGVDKP